MGTNGMGMGPVPMGMSHGSVGMGQSGVRTDSPYSMQNPQQLLNSQNSGMMGMGGQMMNGMGTGPGMMGMNPQRPQAMNNQLAVYQTPAQQMFGQVR